MFKQKSKIISACLGLVVLSGCNYNLQSILAGDWRLDQYENQVKELRAPNSIVVCRSKQCAPAKLSMSREYIFNSLLHLLENNNHKTALICQANALSRVCVDNYIQAPIQVGITPAHMYIDSVKITDVTISPGNEKINLVLNYNLTYNGQSPDCTASKAILFARSVNHVLMEDVGYNCKMTAIGQTTVKNVFSIDYIDLDYGYIGGYYSIGLSGPAFGGSTGYMIMRLPKSGFPLSPVLTNKQSGTEIANDYVNAPKVSSGSGGVQNIGGVQVFPIAKGQDAAPSETSAAEGQSLSEALEGANQ